MTMSLLTSWISHCWSGPCEFGRSGEDTFTIQTDQADGRGGWICQAADVDLSLGRPLVLHGSYHTGRIQGLCFAGEEIVWSERLEPGLPFTPPVDADRLRIDLRLWDTQGLAEFREIGLSLYVEPRPEPEPEPEPDPDPGLPLPPVDTLQAHRVSGYKWGRVFLLWDIDGEEAAVPPQGCPWEVAGYQVGRSLSLQVQRPYIPDDEEQE